MLGNDQISGGIDLLDGSTNQASSGGMDLLGGGGVNDLLGGPST